MRGLTKLVCAAGAGEQRTHEEAFSVLLSVFFKICATLKKAAVSFSRANITTLGRYQTPENAAP